MHGPSAHVDEAQPSHALRCYFYASLSRAARANFQMYLCMRCQCVPAWLKYALVLFVLAIGEYTLLHTCIVAWRCACLLTVQAQDSRSDNALLFNWNQAHFKSLIESPAFVAVQRTLQVHGRCLVHGLRCKRSALLWQLHVHHRVSQTQVVMLLVWRLLQDADVRPLRERREWYELLDTLDGGMSSASRQKFRTEAKAPFRSTRTVIFGGLSIGAGIGLLIITAQLVAAMRGVTSGPDLQSAGQNFAINVAAVALFVGLTVREVRARKQDKSRVAREEELGRLQVRSA